jgi:primosomal protein N' (replication factor Y)
MEGATVVLGSATPSLETYHNCARGKYTLLKMLERADDKKMPVVRVVDMRQTIRKSASIPIFSPQLKEAIAQRLERREQVILFLNRRGYSSVLQCPLCGYVAGCPNCSLSLTYHRQEQKLSCHICAHEEAVPSLCPNPKCRNPEIRFGGIGTQKVEEALGKLFPHARIKRMDSDALKRKDDFRRILGDFRVGNLDILVGTQMIAKGLHFPNVTLVGIIFADLTLHQPDFRAGERTFQLLTQVAGRAGRGDVEGEVFVQAFTPFHPAIQYARRHDFPGFYEQEIEFRKQLKYPPFARTALLTLKGRSEDKVKFSAEYLKRELDKALIGLEDVIVCGPAPAPLLRAQSYYRYQVMLRTVKMSALSQKLSSLSQSLSWPEDVQLSIDIDPVDLT